MFSKTYRFVLVFAIILFAHRSTAQFSNYSEPFIDVKGRSGVSFNLGANTFLGDLGGNQGTGKPYFKDFNTKTVRPLIGASYTYFPLSWLSVKAGLNYTWVTGADSLIKNKFGHAAGRYNRNLSFRSAITEMSAEAEWYPLQMTWKYGGSSLRPFISSGIGFFHFNPKAQLNGQWVELQPLHLEGQGFTEYPDRKNYNRTQIYIPLSVGLKYQLNDYYFISLSSTFRKTFTDYIDDVSTNYIDPKLFDRYLSPDQAKLAKQLYYRGNSSQGHNPGPYRGYSSLDSYTSVIFTFTYIIRRSENYYYHRP